MKLFEFEAKEFFKKVGVPVPEGTVVETPQAAREAYQELGIETLCSTALGAGVFQDYLLDRSFRSVEEYMGLCEIISQSVPHGRPE